MNRPYTAHSPYSLTPTERIDSPGADRVGVVDLDDDYEGLDEDYDYEYDDEYDEPIDRRWVWVAGVAGAILLVAVVCTIVILGGGDSGSVTSTAVRSSATQASRPATTSAAPAATTPSAPPAAPLAPETVTTVTPTPSLPPAAAAPTDAAPVPAAAPNTITYRVTGNRNLIDLVTVIYTDQQGALQTDVNVALPWSKTVVLDPGVSLSSVTATSVAGQLNCTITDTNGAVIAAQSTNTMITNCTK